APAVEGLGELGADLLDVGGDGDDGVFGGQLGGGGLVVGVGGPLLETDGEGNAEDGQEGDDDGEAGEGDWGGVGGGSSRRAAERQSVWSIAHFATLPLCHFATVPLALRRYRAWRWGRGGFERRCRIADCRLTFWGQMGLGSEFAIMSAE